MFSISDIQGQVKRLDDQISQLTFQRNVLSGLAKLGEGSAVPALTEAARTGAPLTALAEAPRSGDIEAISTALSQALKGA